MLLFRDNVLTMVVTTVYFYFVSEHLLLLSVSTKIDFLSLVD